MFREWGGVTSTVSLRKRGYIGSAWLQEAGPKAVGKRSRGKFKLEVKKNLSSEESSPKEG